MRRILLNVALVIGIVWFMLVEAMALLMSTGLADEPGDTNGFKRFLIFSLSALPGLAVAIICGVCLRRDRTSGPPGFPVTSSDVPKSTRTHD